MFCRQCGSEIPNNAKFCTFCGTKVITLAEETEPLKSEAQSEEESSYEGNEQNVIEAGQANCVAPDSAPLSQEQAAPSESSNSSGAKSLKAAVESNKKRSRRHVPMIILVALALALATSVAYAAYRVYTDVWLPYQAEQEMKAKHPLEDENGDTITTEASGNPKNALQIAELMTMKPSEIPSFLDAQGLKYSNGEYVGGQWAINHSDYLDENYPDIFRKPASDDNRQINLYIGSNTSIVSPHALGSSATKQQLNAGIEPAGIMISGLPFKRNLGDDEISSFCEKAELGKPLEKFTCTATLTDSSMPLATEMVVYTGIASSSNDEKILWYLTRDNSTQGQTLFGCIKLSSTYEALVKPYDLYMNEDWNNADNRQKARMVAASLVQESFGGEGFGARVNVLTHKVEFEKEIGQWKEGKESGIGFISPWDGILYPSSQISDYDIDSIQTEMMDL